METTTAVHITFYLITCSLNVLTFFFLMGMLIFSLYTIVSICVHKGTPPIKLCIIILFTVLTILMLEITGLGTCITLGYTKYAGQMYYDVIDSVPRRIWIMSLGAGAFLQSIILDVVLYSWAKINSLHSMDQVYKKASRVLFVLIFVKNIGVALAWLIGAIFYLPDFTNIPLIICTIIAAGLIALQLCAFGWMSYKVRKSISEQTNMTTNPMLKVVRAKIITTVIITLICDSIALALFVFMTQMALFFKHGQHGYGLSLFPAGVLITILEYFPMFWVVTVAYSDKSIVVVALKRISLQKPASSEKQLENV